MDSVASQSRPRRSWSVRKKAFVVAVVAAIIVGVGFGLSYFRESPWFFSPYVDYSYTVAVVSDKADQFRVLCPFPANAEGEICSRALTSLSITGSANTAQVTTPYGQALEIVGSGLVMVTWNSHSELPGPWEGYKDYRYLSMTNGVGYDANASIYSDSEDIQFGLRFHYEYVYGNVGADFISYEVVGTVNLDWNTLSVDYSHAVA